MNYNTGSLFEYNIFFINLRYDVVAIFKNLNYNLNS